MRRKKWKAIGALCLSFNLLCGSVPLSFTEAKAAEAAQSGLAAEDIAAGISAPVIMAGQRGIDMPAVPGGSVRFLADYEQVIGEDGTIYEPLEEKTIKGFYEVTAADGSTAKTEEFTVTVPGQYLAGTGENPKPGVIPALQEWYGGTGSFVTSAAGRIVVGSEELMPAANVFAGDYEAITGLAIPVIKGQEADLRIGDFYLSLTDGTGLGKEGYALDIGRAVIVEAEDPTGTYWATRSILQILKQTGGSIPKGLVRDYPKYEVRGLNLDVARKPFTLDVLYDFAKNMSWYKLNSFQVHLSDNLIFMEDYASRDDAIEQAYAGFRLESGITNNSGESATSEDLYYGKEEFRQFIQDSRVIGVDIVPELDFPAHALAFTKVFPEYMSDGFNTGQYSSATGQYRPLIDELDISNAGAIQLVKDLWSEYLDGEDPVFDEETTVHIGTDEFHGGGSQSNEYFRAFSDELITFLQEQGRTVRMWGSLTNKSGQTPVTAKGVQANIWSVDYGRPKQMYDLGYGLINTVDRWLYMVPNGTNGRGMYNDYLNVQGLYNNWKVNTMYEDTAYGYTVPAGDEQMLGACFAIWHDNIDTRASGISQYDSFLRFMDTAPVFSEKLWGDGAEEKSYAEFVEAAEAAGTAPNTVLGAKTDYVTNTIAEYTFESTTEQDESVNGYTLGTAVNANAGEEDGEKTLKLNGGVSYVETPFDLLEPGAVLTLKVKMDEDATGEQILCESREKFGTDGAYAIKAAVKQTGNVGFSREGYDYSFDYQLPAGEWVELSFYSGENKSVSLHVKDADGESVYDNPKYYDKNHPDTEMSAAKGNAHVNTLLIPFGHIGSDSDSFQGQIAQILLTGTKDTGEGIGAEELKAELDKYAKYEKSMYADAGWAAFEEAVNDAWRVLDNKYSTEEDYLSAYDSLRQKASEMIALKDVLNDSELRQYRLVAALKEAEAQAGNTTDYTYESVRAYKNVLAAAEAVLVKSNPTEKELEDALTALQNIKLVTKLSVKREELMAAITDAGKKLSDTAGYTAASVEALRQALQAAQKVFADENATLAELTSALDSLRAKELIKDAAGGQNPVPTPAPEKTIKKGQKSVVGGMTYKVTDADKKEVTLAKGKNVKTVKIGASVKIDGITCKVTAIAAGAFLNCSALSSVTVGKNVTAIGKKAFYKCGKLKKVILQGKKAPSVGKKAFGKTASGISVQAKNLSKKARTSLLGKLKKTGGMGSKAKMK